VLKGVPLDSFFVYSCEICKVVSLNFSPEDFFKNWQDVADKGNEKSKTLKNLYEAAQVHHWRHALPPPVVAFLEDFKTTERFKNLQADYRYLVNYRAKWETTPFPITFTTVDCVVIKDGHVLMVKRKVHPGKGLLALPGGFINQNEWIFDAAIRELREETKIRLIKDDKEDLAEWKKCLTEQKVFDHPERSLRGRVVTHCFCFQLPSGGDLPEVRGADDAEKAFWMPIGDIGFRETELFEDHGSIVQHFVWRTYKT
jgi:bifunctional NMN adenylyltransferase/nudix hydrolase